MLPFYKNKLVFAVMVILSFQMMSCTTTKKVVYFNDLADSTSGSLRNAQLNFEAQIQKNDQLMITVGGSNQLDLTTLNSASGMGTGTTASVAGGTTTGYLVESDGNIKFPFIGKVQAEGLTRLQLEDKLTELFKDYTKNPVVNVRFMNYNFSVMGEVNNKGRFNMPGERTTILEAISMAGDLTDMGKRENVLVIREVNGQRNFYRVNLLSKDLFTSPYYYLKTNDVVYVEPVKTKFISRSGIPQYLGLVAGAVALLITIINLSN